MMTFQEDLLTLIRSTPVAPLVANRVNWGYRTQGSVVPALTMIISGEETPYVYKGPVNFTRSRVQFDSFASGYAQVAAIDRALLEAISGYGGEVGNTLFRSILFISKFDDSEETGVAAQRVYRVSRDAYCNWQEK